MTWRLMLSPPLPAAANMAIDEALMARARRTREGVVRVYQWQAPTLSLGRNQRANGLYDLEAARHAGVGFVRRPTGGRALLHHRELTYSVTASASEEGSIRESYAWINRLLIDGLSRLGVVASVSQGTAGGAGPPDARPCFEAPAAGELVVGARKLVGSAQWRHEGAMLQHGSILIDDDQGMAVSLLLRPTALPPSPATLRDALGRAPDAMELMDALAAALRERHDGEVSPLQSDEALQVDIDAATARYRADEWTWRR